MSGHHASDLSTADVRVAPWAKNATVVVDVGSLAHWVRKDLSNRIKGLGRNALVGGAPPQVSFRIATSGFHRIADVLSHHGVSTTRLLLAMSLRPFPPASTGWVAGAGDDARPGHAARRVIAQNEALLSQVRERLEPRGVTVEALPGLFGTNSEHCVDEMCVLGAVRAAWDGACDEVVVVSWDADVAVVAGLADGTRIRLARTINSKDRQALLTSAQRHRRHVKPTDIPDHIALLPESLRTMVTADEITDEPVRRAVEMLGVDAVPHVMLAESEGQHVLKRGDDGRTISTPVDAAVRRSWVAKRERLLTRGIAATAVVDPFGLLSAANRAGLPGRVPTADSVARALTPLQLPEPLAQFAVIPDLLDIDHGAIQLAGKIGGIQLVPEVRAVLSERVRRSIIDLDDAVEAALDSYHDDAMVETIATPSLFARNQLTSIGEQAVGMEEKESAVLLAADILWALMRTDGPLVVMTERPDLVALLDLMDEYFGADLRMQERLLRIGLHADPFSGDGIAVRQSRNERSRWATFLLTGRMLAELLRMDPELSGSAATSEEGMVVIDALAYDATLGEFTVIDMNGEPLGAVQMADVVQLPAEDLQLLGDDLTVAADEFRARLATRVRLQLDLSRPLARPLLAPTSEGSGRVSARILSAQVIARGDGEVTVRITRGAREKDTIVAQTPRSGIVLGIGRTVEVVVEDDGRHCRLTIPNLATLPDSVGRPRPVRLIDDGRAELLEPFDPDDQRFDTGTIAKTLPLRGPYPAPEVGDTVFATSVDERTVQIVSTAVPWSTL
jgi:hypothetical protein